MKKSLSLCAAAVFGLSVFTTSAALPVIARDPYIGAIVIDAATGETLFEDNADRTGYPASMLKLMDMLIILERVQSGLVGYDARVTTSAAASRMGGSQVYLKEHEVFSLEDMLYALMIQSANDAALALAEHFAGAKDGFVHLMNQKARELGMDSTRFFSPHGLPPGEGQSPDVTTARDFAKLCRELCRHPDIFRFTSARERDFRDGTFIMRNHNNLLGVFPGCDGFKTGYFRAGGYSIAATAEREGRRVIAVVLGSVSKQVRDAKARELLSIGLANALSTPQPVIPPAAPVAASQLPAVPEEADDLELENEPQDLPPAGGGCGGFWTGLLAGLGVGALAYAGVKLKQRRDSRNFIRRS